MMRHRCFDVVGTNPLRTGCRSDNDGGTRMTIGLIARADARGLGIQTKAFHDHMRPAKTIVIDCPSAQPLPIRRDWYPDATWIHGLPTAADWRKWLDGLTAVYTAETGYGHTLWDEADRAGVRTVLHANYEFLNTTDRPTMWAAPSTWHLDQWPAGTVHLPVPIETSRFTSAPLQRAATRFLHIVGRPAIHDRAGTDDLLIALRHVTQPITVTLRCQDPKFTPTVRRIPDHVTVNIEAGDTPNYWDNYRDQHVLIAPRRYGGLSLPTNEALAAGMPVIMPAIAPNTDWLPCEWLVPAQPAGSFRAKQHIDYYRVDPLDLAAKIDEMATGTLTGPRGPAPFSLQQVTARNMAADLSWDRLSSRYRDILTPQEAIR